MIGDARQQVADDYFDAESTFWDTIYEREDVYSVIHQERRRRALAWIDGLGLPVGARVLEVGCGAGLTSVALAQRGLEVSATDSADRMVELTRQRVEAARLDSRVQVSKVDVHALDFTAGAFDLVVALGVIPWLHSPPRALSEMGRVLKPDGYVVVTADNRLRLVTLFDPRLSGVLAPARAKVKALLARKRLHRPAAPALTGHTPGEFNGLLAAADLERLTTATLGFGPFTLFGRKVLNGQRAVRLHHYLQRLADHDVPGFRGSGSQYLVLAQKRTSNDF